MKPKSIFLLNSSLQRTIYNDAALQKISALTVNDGKVHESAEILAHPEDYADVEIIFSGWGCPKMEVELLEALPNVKALFYGAGSIKGLATDAFWNRNILLTSAYTANAVPVSEFTVASVIFALKKAWVFNREIRQGNPEFRAVKVPGVYHGSAVGIVSLGAIGQLVCKKLSQMDVDVFAFDPYASDALFEECGATRVDSLQALFSTCQVVSLHAPWLPQTEDMITGELLRSMPEGATFINTSRGRIVVEAEMIEVLKERPDLFAVIDVITDESDYRASPLAQLPNTFLTPHIAGSTGLECHRMGALAVEECERYLKGEPPVVPVTRESAEKMA